MFSQIQLKYTAYTLTTQVLMMQVYFYVNLFQYVPVLYHLVFEVLRSTVRIALHHCI